MKTIGVIVLLTVSALALIITAIALEPAGHDGAALADSAALSRLEPAPPAMSGDLMRYGAAWCAAPPDPGVACSNA